MSRDLTKLARRKTTKRVSESPTTLGEASSSMSQSMDIHVKSAPEPLFIKKDDSEKCTLKVQISAPSYWNSLSANEASPFKKPGPVIKPRLIIGTIMNEEEAVLMIAASESTNGLAQFLGRFLVDKKVITNYSLIERDFLIIFIKEAINLASIYEFNAYKLACLITIYLDAHLFFKRYYWESRENVWYYFKEILIRHTIEDSPIGQEVFEPEESYDILSHFHTIYLVNLPLIHILTFNSCRLKFVWPFKK